MNSKKSIILTVILVLVLLIIAGTSIVYAQSRQVEKGRANQSLAGAWMVIATIEDPSGIPPITNPAVMTQDGLIINSNETGNTAIGVWAKANDNQYATTFTGFEVSEGQTIQYKIRATLTLSKDGQTYTGPFVNEIFDSAGNLLFSITGVVNGTRMQVEPLN